MPLGLHLARCELVDAGRDRGHPARILVGRWRMSASCILGPYEGSFRGLRSTLRVAITVTRWIPAKVGLRQGLARTLDVSRRERSAFVSPIPAHPPWRTAWGNLTGETRSVLDDLPHGTSRVPPGEEAVGSPHSAARSLERTPRRSFRR